MVSQTASRFAGAGPRLLRRAWYHPAVSTTFRWVVGLFWRGVTFWGSWLLFFGAIESLAGKAEWSNFERITRLSLFLGAFTLLFSEWSLVNRWALALDSKLRERGITSPKRVEWVTHGVFSFILMVVPWWFVLALFSTRLHEMWGIDPGGWFAVAGIAACAWALASLLVITLLLSRVSLLRLHLAARKLPLEDRPNLRPAFPVLVAVWASGALLLAMIGVPDVGSSIQLAADVARIVNAAQEANSAAVQQQANSGDVQGPSAPRGIQAHSAFGLDPMVAGRDCEQGRTYLPVNDPLASAQSDLANMGASGVLTLLATSQPRAAVTVAVIDSGIDSSHPDLRGVMRARRVNDDYSGHGTAVAGLIAAVANNGVGMASFNANGAYVRVSSYPALASSDPSADDVAQAIRDAADSGAAVINMSFGGPGQAPAAVQSAVAHAAARGIILVAAAGNDAQDASNEWPANLPGVLVVGATNDDGWTAFSNTTRGVRLAVAAPGESVCTLTTGGGYREESGTSMAAPLVSGLLASMRAFCPSLRASEAVSIVIATGTQHASGLGPSVQADAAFREVLTRHPECGGGSDGYSGSPSYRARDPFGTATYAQPTYAVPTYTGAGDDDGE